MYYLLSPPRERFDPRAAADPAAIIRWCNPDLMRDVIENGLIDS